MFLLQLTSDLRVAARQLTGALNSTKQYTSVAKTTRQYTDVAKTTRRYTDVAKTTRPYSSVAKTTRLYVGVVPLWRQQRCQPPGLHRGSSLPTSILSPSPHSLAASRAAHFCSPHPPSSPVGQCASHMRVGGSLSKSFSTHTGTHREGLMGSDNVHLHLNGRQACIPWLWLRDHCRCQTCYNASTFQKNTDSYSLTDLAVIESVVDSENLFIKWQDGHRSVYSLQWLVDNFDTATIQPQRFLWDGQSMNNQPLPTTPFELHMNTEDGLKNTLSNLVRYGLCVVDGAPATAEGTAKVSQRICHILETLYGGVTTMVSGQLDHSDTAYTALPLEAHNDTTYFNMSAGLQVFHCLEHDGEGGNTLLVDGFRAADRLASTHPDYFDCLTTTLVPHEYISAEHHLYSLATVLSTDPMSGELTQIRFNPYDRAPLRTVAAEDIAHFYDSYAALTRIIRSTDSPFWLKLKPGMVLMVDNWRVMHGRSGFTGKRVLCGCYLPRDDWTSRARVLRLL